MSAVPASCLHFGRPLCACDVAPDVSRTPRRGQTPDQELLAAALRGGKGVRPLVRKAHAKSEGKKWQGRLSRKQSIALPKVVNARGLLNVKPPARIDEEEVVPAAWEAMDHRPGVTGKGVGQKPGVLAVLACSKPLTHRSSCPVYPGESLELAVNQDKLCLVRLTTSCSADIRGSVARFHQALEVALGRDRPHNTVVLQEPR